MPTHTRSRSRSDVDLRKTSSTRRDSADNREKKHRSRRESSSRSASKERRSHRSSRVKEQDSPAEKKRKDFAFASNQFNLGSSRSTTEAKPAVDDFKITMAAPVAHGTVNPEDLKDEMGDF
jgi:ATP-dependent RNA helicase DDX21